MRESIQKLEDRLHEKERELESVGNKLTGAGIGAALTKNPLLGAAVGGYLGREKDHKAQLERDIAALKQQIQDTHTYIDRLHAKQASVRNTFQNDKAHFEADMRTKRRDLERQRQNAQDPNTIRQLDEQLGQFQHEVDQQEQQRSQAMEHELHSIQQEIDSLTF